MSKIPQAPGVIERDAAYTKAEFMTRLDMDEDGWKGLKRRGMTVRYDGKRVYVLGADWLAYLQQCADKPGGRG